MHVGRVEVLDGSYKYGEKERGGGSEEYNICFGGCVAKICAFVDCPCIVHRGT